MSKFAKIIDLPDEEAQVLATIEWNLEDDTYDFTLKTEFDGCYVKSSIPFADRKWAEAALERFDSEKAKNYYANAVSPNTILIGSVSTSIAPFRDIK